jgi:hypothetical protein
MWRQSPRLCRDASHEFRIAFKKLGQTDLSNSSLQQPEHACAIVIGTGQNSPAPRPVAKLRRARACIKVVAYV